MRVLRHCLDFQEGKPLACIGLGADITDGLRPEGMFSLAFFVGGV